MNFSADGFKRLNAKMAFSGPARARVYRKLANFLRNGMSLNDALQTMYGHATNEGKTPNDPIAYILKDWLNKVSNGWTMGRAVAEWVPSTDRIIIEAGEAAGALEAALVNALYIQGSGKKIKSEIQKGVAYPIVLVILAIGLLIIFGTRIVPAFEDILPREKWEGTAAMMAQVADFVRHGLAPTIAAVLTVIGVMMWSLPRWTGKLRVRFDNYPPWALYRLSSGAGFMLSLSALLRAGVQVPEILRILKRGANPWYAERINTALNHVNNGINIGEALHKGGHNFPDKETVQDLRAYAQFSGFDSVLETLAREWIEDSVEKIKSQMGLLRTISIIVLGAIFGIIATGIFALQQQVGSAMNG